MRARHPSLVLAVAAAGLIALAGCSAVLPAASNVGATSAAATPASSPTAAPPAVVAMGDSIMSGYHLDSGQDWPTLLAADRDDTVLNVACSGAGFVAVGDCGTDFAGLIPEAVKGHPDFVIVQGSDNDQGQSAAALDAATSATIAELHRRLPDARIVGLSTLWNQASAAPAEIADSSAAVHRAVTDIGGIYLDIGQPLQNRPDLLQPDHEHPTAEGQKVLLLTVEKALDDAGVGI